MLTTREVAERLKVKVITVQRWLKAGKLQGVRLPNGGDWRVDEAEVQRIERGQS